MRILMVSQFYPPIIGGEEQHVRVLSAALVARGHHVAVATLWHEGLPSCEVDDHGVRIYRLRSTTGRLAALFTNGARRHAPPFPDPEALLGLRRIIAAEYPDIIHVHNWLGRSVLPLKAWSKARIVVTLHNYNLTCPKNSLMYGDAPCSGPKLVKCLGCATHHYGLAKGPLTVLGHRMCGPLERQTVDSFVAVSTAVAEGTHLAGQKAPFAVVPTLIPDALITANPESPLAPGLLSAKMRTGGDAQALQPYLDHLPAEPYILFVGALGRFKGVATLLQAYAALPDAPPLVLIGYPTPDMPTVTSKTHPGVTVLHNWPRAAVVAAWQRSLLGAVPSLWPDPCPTVALEAMAASKPVIASRIGGLPDEVLDGETGLLIPPGNAEALRDAMALLIRDPALRERMGQAGQRHVVAFSASRVAERIECLFLDTLKRASKEVPA